MARVQLYCPDESSLVYIAENLRHADADELRATHGADVDFKQCLRVAVAISEEVHCAYTAVGEPFAVFGIAPALIDGQGIPWMLGTDIIALYGREVVALSRAHVARWGLKYPCLFNYVDARNLRSIVWLRRTGFSILDAAPYGVEGLPFHRFERCM